MDLITVDQVMEEQKLGPNGALIQCIEHLDRNFKWLEDRINSVDHESYFLFDCPGQVELFICNTAFKQIISRIELLHFRLATVHLVDSFYLHDPTKFISVLLLTLQSMLQLEYPRINVLTKIDNIRSFGHLRKDRQYYSSILFCSI